MAEQGKINRVEMTFSSSSVMCSAPGTAGAAGDADEAVEDEMSEGNA